MQAAPGGLLHRSPNILLIPGTSSVVHLREKLAAAECARSDAMIRALLPVPGPRDTYNGAGSIAVGELLVGPGSTRTCRGSTGALQTEQVSTGSN